MTAKEWLNRARLLDVQITALEKEKQWALERATGTTCIPKAEPYVIPGQTSNYTAMDIQSSSYNSGEARIVDYADYSMRLTAMEYELLKIKSEITEAISQVENGLLRTLLFLRYIRFMPWEKVAEEIGMSARWVRTRMHSKALSEIEKIIKL